MRRKRPDHLVVSCIFLFPTSSQFFFLFSRFSVTNCMPKLSSYSPIIFMGVCRWIKHDMKETSDPKKHMRIRMTQADTDDDTDDDLGHRWGHLARPEVEWSCRCRLGVGLGRRTLLLSWERQPPEVESAVAQDCRGLRHGITAEIWVAKVRTRTDCSLWY